ncbi:MAG: hypothetical protein WBW38_05030 [Candidatus Sulfotelmatobacter sp.]
MPNAPRSRKTFRISDSLNRKLNTYAQVAAAAGASVLALAGASEAEVVYTETHQVTHTGFPLYIDLNHDGIKDFKLRTMYYAGTSGLDVGLDASGFSANMVAGRRSRTSGGYFYSAASALPAGARIGPEGNFSVPSPFMAVEFFKEGDGSQYSDQGPWARKGKGVKNRYLGLKFVVDGKVHYGWARLSVTLGHQRQFDDVIGTLTGYAYETIPDKPIIAGRITGPDVITVQAGQEQGAEGSVGRPGSAPLAQPAQNPATLGMLARGSAALPAWRRKQSAPEGK